MAIQTVNNIIQANTLGMADAHVHVWAKFEKYTAENVFPEVDDFQLIKNNLLDFKKSGGDLVVDCTPYGRATSYMSFMLIQGSKLYVLQVFIERNITFQALTSGVLMRSRRLHSFLKKLQRG
jgi:predicted metal-dependent phosphotriesterase family hydrolase